MINNICFFFTKKANRNTWETGNSDQTCSLGRYSTVGLHFLHTDYSLDFRIIAETSIFVDISDKFQLEKGWALKSNQKYGQRGSGKRITITVKAYLEGFFLAGM